MTIQSIRLQNFRSYRDESFEFAPGVNIIVGANASGKTNLLESLLLVSVGKSYRATDGELVQFQKPWARVEAHSETESRIIKLEKDDPARTKKSFILDHTVYKRLPLHTTLPIVLFEPNHLQLFTSSPELRRAFLDGLISQLVSGYDRVLRQYKRTLSQRNALLKKGPTIGTSQLFAWNVRLSELGGQIAKERLLLVERLNDGLDGVYAKLAHTKKTKLLAAYASSCPSENYSSSLLQKLEQETELDFMRGFTSYGPHRDDVEVLFDQYRLESVASRGETRTVILALKIMELQLIEATRGKAPLLLLDDVFSELDGARRQTLTNFLSPYQTFITTTDADVVVQHFMNKCHIIPIQKA